MQVRTQQLTMSMAEPWMAPVARPHVPAPERWHTAHDPMTRAQQAYLNTLARIAGVYVPQDLTKAQAAQHIDELQRATGFNG